MPDPIVHFEFAGPDETELHTFYENTFGWVVSPRGPGYAMVETPNLSPNGAILEDEFSHLILGIKVDDLDASIEKAVASGGRLVMPPMDNGYVNKAQVCDPSGNVISLIGNRKPRP